MDSRISTSETRQERKVLLSSEVWQLAIASVKGTWRQSMILIGLGMVLPQLLVNTGLDATSQAVVDELRALFTSKTTQNGSPLIFGELVSPAAAYFSRVGPTAVGLAIVCLSSYLGLVQTTSDYLRKVPPRGAFASWLAGLKKSIPTAITLLLLTVMVAIAGQMVLVPAMLIGVLSLMIPAIVIVENRGAAYALRSAVLLRYIRGTGYSGWSVIFNLISLGAFLYGTMAATGLLAELILNLDEALGISRGLWIAQLPSMGVSPIYFLVSIFEPLLSMACLGILASLTTAMYFIVQRDAEGRAIAQA